jgi:hypothetical protein
MKFEVDGSVCCSCDFFERVGIVCRHILAIVHNLDESMVDVCWRAALGFYFGKPTYNRDTSVIIQALESSLKKVKVCIPSLETSYPVYSDGTNESFLSLFFHERCRTAIYHQDQVSTSSVCMGAMLQAGVGHTCIVYE